MTEASLQRYALLDVVYPTAQWLIVIQILFLIILLAAGLLANFCLLYVLRLLNRTRVLLPTHRFVAALASLHILACAIIAPTKIGIIAGGGVWYLGHIGCAAFVFMEGFICYSTAFIPATIAFERYMDIGALVAVPREIARRASSTPGESVKRVHVILMALSAAAGVLAAPQLLVYRATVVDGVTYCKASGYSSQYQRSLYITFSAVFTLFAPTMLTLISLCRTYKSVLHRGVKPPSVKKFLQNGSKIPSRHGLPPLDPFTTYRDRRFLLFMTLSLTIVYLLTWSPYMLTELALVYGFVDLAPAEEEQLVALVETLAFLNSVITPLLWALFNGARVRYVFGQLRADHNTGTGSSRTSTDSSAATREAAHYEEARQSDDVGHLEVAEELVAVLALERDSTVSFDNTVL